MPRTNRPSQLVGRNTTATQARQNEALRLRERGMAYADIAHHLGYAGPQGAAEAIRVARRRLANNTASTVIANVAAQTAPANAAPQVPSNRTFGFEAEFFGISIPKAIQALAAVGINCVAPGYTHAVMADWKIVPDVSVTSTGTGTGRGHELVSPVLRGQAGLETAAKAVNALQAAGGKVDKSCGLHVHIGMDGLTGRQIVNVLDLYAANQNTINGLVARSRHNNTYCKSQADRRVRDMSIGQVGQAVTATEIRRASANLGNDKRFVAVNLVSYAKYGTVEFRQHQGSLNGEKVTSWIKFILATVELGSTGHTAAFASLDEMLMSLNLTDETKQFLNSRAARLAMTR